MKSFLIRACTKMGRFIWSWLFLKFALWMITAIIFLYIEEDWRGARAWAATKAEWETKGESFDYNKLIPPPVPDDQNLAAIPLFKMEPDPQDKDKTHLVPLTLLNAIRSKLPGGMVPWWSGWQKGLPPDFEKIHKDIATEYADAFGAQPSNSDPLAQFDALYPFITELNAASSIRPFCRFAEDYTSQPPYWRSLSLIMSQIKLTQLVVIHAILALNEKQPAVALADIETLAKIDSALGHEPILVSGLVADGIDVLNASPIGYGLELHAWNDAQLAGIEASLVKLDALADYQLVMRGEFTGFSLPTIEYFKMQRPRIQDFFGIPDKASPFYPNDPDFSAWPKGWLDLSCSRMANTMLGATSLVDPEAHRVFVGQADDSDTIINKAIHSAHAQTWIDEARIACALERYRLVHGAYPESLEMLAPAGLDSIPCDPINGQAYRYRVRPDGNFLLYSVGWNQRDDGGVGVFALTNPADPNDSPQRHGDWVWPTAK